MPGIINKTGDSKYNSDLREFGRNANKKGRPAAAPSNIYINKALVSPDQFCCYR